MVEGQLIKSQAAVFEALFQPLAPLMEQYRLHTAPHALMISGPFGVGKATLAALLAQTLLCTGSAKPCETCSGCRQARRGSHANLLQVGALPRQRSVKVDQARALLANLATHPFSPGPRVVMLEKVDTFTPQAQNALLKAIEEPDSATSFLLTCQNEHAVLPTIRSRCRLVRLPAWPVPLVHQALLMQGLPEEEAGALSQRAMGSPGKALAARADSGYQAMKDTLDQLLTINRDLSRFPALSNQLRDLRERSDQALDYLEDAALGLTGQGCQQAMLARIVLEGVQNARMQQASNLSWQAIADQLLMNILEVQDHA